MKELTDPRLAKMLFDVLNFRGLSILTYPSAATNEAEITPLRDLEILEGPYSDSYMIPYLIATGLEEGWLHITVDDTAPGNKYAYINKLLDTYRPPRRSRRKRKTKTLYRVE